MSGKMGIRVHELCLNGGKSYAYHTIKFPTKNNVPPECTAGWIERNVVTPHLSRIDERILGKMCRDGQVSDQCGMKIDVYAESGDWFGTLQFHHNRMSIPMDKLINIPRDDREPTDERWFNYYDSYVGGITQVQPGFIETPLSKLPALREHIGRVYRGILSVGDDAWRAGVCNGLDQWLVDMSDVVGPARIEELAPLVEEIKEKHRPKLGEIF